MSRPIQTPRGDYRLFLGRRDFPAPPAKAESQPDGRTMDEFWRGLGPLLPNSHGHAGARHWTISEVMYRLYIRRYHPVAYTNENIEKHT